MADAATLCFCKGCCVRHFAGAVIAASGEGISYFQCSYFTFLFCGSETSKEFLGSRHLPRQIGLLRKWRTPVAKSGGPKVADSPQANSHCFGPPLSNTLSSYNTIQLGWCVGKVADTRSATFPASRKAPRKPFAPATFPHGESRFACPPPCVSRRVAGG